MPRGAGAASTAAVVAAGPAGAAVGVLGVDAVAAAVAVGRATATLAARSPGSPRLHPASDTATHATQRALHTVVRD